MVLPVQNTRVSNSTPYHLRRSRTLTSKSTLILGQDQLVATAGLFIFSWPIIISCCVRLPALSQAKPSRGSLQRGPSEGQTSDHTMDIMFLASRVGKSPIADGNLNIGLTSFWVQNGIMRHSLSTEFRASQFSEFASHKLQLHCTESQMGYDIPAR
ncbi:hypothetical protein BDV19DRAFT_76251 [Aspergillus venezuelensis]